MSERWSLAGYEVQELVDGGRAGDLWRARELASGELVALRRLSRAADSAERLRRSVALQADLPCAVRLRDVVDDGHVLVLVLDHAPGGALDTLLTRRGALAPGEVVTVGVPLAEALAAAHARGLVHGSLTASSVLFAADGMPLLAGIGLSVEQVEPQDDVAALAALCRSLLGPAATGSAHAPGPVPGAGLAELLAVLESAYDSARAPDAAHFGAALRRAHPASPVRRGRPVAPAGGDAHAPVTAGGGRWSGVPFTAALVLLVLAGAAAGWWSGRGGEQPPPRGATSSAGVAGPAGAAGTPSAAAPATAEPAARPGRAAASTLGQPEANAAPAGRAQAVAPVAPTGEWPPVLDALDQMRAAAFATADERALRAVYAPGSPGLDADLRLVRRLSAAGRTAAGVRHAVREVHVLARTAGRVRLRVVHVLGAYEVRDAEGAVVSRATARAARTSVVELHRTPAGWRLVAVRPP